MMENQIAKLYIGSQEKKKENSQIFRSFHVSVQISQSKHELQK